MPEFDTEFSVTLEFELGEGYYPLTIQPGHAAKGSRFRCENFKNEEVTHLVNQSREEIWHYICDLTKLPIKEQINRANSDPGLYSSNLIQTIRNLSENYPEIEHRLAYSAVRRVVQEMTHPETLQKLREVIRTLHALEGTGWQIIDRSA